MIETLQVANFRCFEQLLLTDLRRINLIVGTNASGKTALLEAIFLAAAASPEVIFRFRAWRGMGEEIVISRDRGSYETLWKDLFYSFEQDRTIQIVLQGSAESTRSITVFYDLNAPLSLPLGPVVSPESSIVPVVFEWKKGAGQPHRLQVEISERGLTHRGPAEALNAAFFSAGSKGGVRENAARFSDLSKRGQEAAVLDALRREFPYVQGLSVEINASVPMLYAKVETIGEKLPVALVSEGVHKLLTVLLAIANMPHGVVLVDEIENGFYYERMPRIWSALLGFCESYDVQLFASTHSMECLRALLPVVRNRPDQFSLLRATRQDGYVAITKISGMQLTAALEEGFEVR